MLFIVPIRSIVDQALIDFPFSDLDPHETGPADEAAYIEALCMMVRHSVTECIDYYSKWGVPQSKGTFVNHVVYKRIYSEILQQVFDHFPEQYQKKGWHILSQRHFKEIVVVEDDGDYRIYDWTRRMESGEWE